MISDVGKVAGLDERIKLVVVECYVKSLEHSHSKFSGLDQGVELTTLVFSLGCSFFAFLIAFTIREHSLE